MKNSDLKRFYEPDASNNNEGFARLDENGRVNAPVASNKINTGNTVEGKLLAADGQGGVKFVDDNSGTTVVANPTLAGTEGSLNGLQVGETKYKVDVGTTVVANPVLAGTEADLNGLQVGETKYKVNAGTTVNVRVSMYKEAQGEPGVTDMYKINLHVEGSLIGGFLTSLASAGYIPSSVTSVQDLCDYYSDVADLQGKLNIVAFMMIYFVGQYGYSLSAVYAQEINDGSATTIVTKAMTTECRMDTTASTLKVYFDDTPVDYVAYLSSADSSQLDFYPIR